MMSDALFGNLLTTVQQSVNELQEVAQKQNDVGRVSRCQGFLDWLACDEGVKTLDRIKERCDDDPAIVAAFAEICNHYRKKGLHNEAVWNELCSWVEDALFFIFAAEDMKALLTVV